MEESSPQIVCQSTLPRRFGIILEKIIDRHERSGIAVQWNGGVGLHTLFSDNKEKTNVTNMENWRTRRKEKSVLTYETPWDINLIIKHDYIRNVFLGVQWSAVA